MTQNQDLQPLRNGQSSKAGSRQDKGRGRRHRKKRSPFSARFLSVRMDSRRSKRRLIILTLICANFFFLWMMLKVFAQSDYWPLLAVPILVSAWSVSYTHLRAHDTRPD